MSSQAPKFLLGGVNFKHNFFGLQTIQTAAYGWAEVGIKAAPIFAFFYSVKKLTTYHINERDEVLDERKQQEAVVRRSTLE